MLTLHRYVLALVLWLAFLFNIERLNVDIGTPNLLNIPPAVYVAVLGVTCGALWLGQSRRVSLRAVQVLGVAVFLIAVASDGRPAWGGGYTYLSLVSLGEILVSATLAFQVGRSSADFVHTVQAMVLTNSDSRVYTDADIAPLVKRELQQARRTGRPLSVVVVEPGEAHAPVMISATAREIERLIVKRYRLLALARMVARALRRTDLLLYQTDQERLVLIAPETPREPTLSLVERLTRQIQQRLGVSVHCRVATFPQQGLTFEELLAQAESSDIAEPAVVASAAGTSDGSASPPAMTSPSAVTLPASNLAATSGRSNGHP